MAPTSFQECMFQNIPLKNFFNKNLTNNPPFPFHVFKHNCWLAVIIVVIMININNNHINSFLFILFPHKEGCCVVIFMVVFVYFTATLDWCLTFHTNVCDLLYLCIFKLIVILSKLMHSFNNKKKTSKELSYLFVWMNNFHLCEALCHLKFISHITNADLWETDHLYSSQV